MRKLSALSLLLLGGCAQPLSLDPYVPSMRYAEDMPKRFEPKPQLVVQDNAHSRARVHLVDGEISPNIRPELLNSQGHQDGIGAAYSNEGQLPEGVTVFQSPERQKQPYRGPLEYGEPGMTASLWRENRSGTEMYRDYRAFQPLDLITILVSEKDSGTHNANTNTKAESSFDASIEKLLALEKQVAKWQDDKTPDLASLIKASTESEYKGEGQTARRGELTAKISAVIVEVLPSGLLRIEGEKIVSVNNEEQTMVVSGLVRQRDISSDNEVKSSQIAQMRIDYFGKGSVGDMQSAGWLFRIISKIWPF